MERAKKKSWKQKLKENEYVAAYASVVLAVIAIFGFKFNPLDAYTYFINLTDIEKLFTLIGILSIFQVFTFMFFFFKTRKK